MARIKTSLTSQEKRMKIISKVRNMRTPATFEERIGIVRCATVKGVSVRNRINKRRELARKEVVNYE